MAPIFSNANQSALIVQSHAEKTYNADKVDLQDLEDYLKALERSFSKPTLHKFLDLPAELRGLVYKQIANATTIQLSNIRNGKHWPRICFASPQTYREALPIIYRCAAFEARVVHVDFSEIIGFIQALPRTFLQALSCNDRLTIFIGDSRGTYSPLPIDIHTSIQPWFKLCWSLSNAGTDIRWLYKTVVPSPVDRDWFYASWLNMKSKSRCGYDELKEVYAKLEDERMKDEVAAYPISILERVFLGIGTTNRYPKVKSALV